MNNATFVYNRLCLLVAVWLAQISLTALKREAGLAGKRVGVEASPAHIGTSDAGGAIALAGIERIKVFVLDRP